MNFIIILVYAIVNLLTLFFSILNSYSINIEIMECDLLKMILKQIACISRWILKWNAYHFQPRKALVEQLSRVLPDDSLPDAVSLVSLADPGAAVLATRLQERNHRVLTTASPADIRATFTCLVTRIQKL